MAVQPMQDNRSREFGTGPRTDRSPTSVRISNRGVVETGVGVGLLGGLAFSLLTGLVSAAVQGDFLAPLKYASGLFYGINAYPGGAGQVIVGALIGIIVSAGLGILFAAMAKNLAKAGTALWAGLLYGIGVWLVTTYALLPIFNQTMFSNYAMAIPGWWFVSHLLFGAVMGLTPKLRRSISIQHGREVGRRAA